MKAIYDPKIKRWYKETCGICKKEIDCNDKYIAVRHGKIDYFYHEDCIKNEYKLKEVNHSYPQISALEYKMRYFDGKSLS